MPIDDNIPQWRQLPLWRFIILFNALYIMEKAGPLFHIPRNQAVWNGDHIREVEKGDNREFILAIADIDIMEGRGVFAL